jgi:hypothetical protein
MAPTCLSFYAIDSPNCVSLHSAGQSKRTELVLNILCHSGEFIGRRLMRSSYHEVRPFERALSRFETALVMCAGSRLLFAGP